MEPEIITLVSERQAVGISEVPPLALTVAETAKHLKVSVSQVYKMIDEGELPVKRIGRIIRVSYENLKRWMDEET